MDIYQERMERFRRLRTKYLSGIGKFLFKIGISANIMTGFSLVFGILAVYFLFSNHSLFILFAALHLIADGLDGVIARVSKSTIFGNYFEHICDGVVGLLVLIKIGMFTGDYLAYLIAGLYLLAQTTHFSFLCQPPCLFTRTLTLILAALFIPDTFPWSKYTLTVIILINGVAYLYSLARQLQYFIIKFRSD